MYRLPGRILKWAFLLIVAVLLLFPVVMAILGAFKTNLELNTGGSILPESWKIDNFIYTWKEAGFSRYVANSLLYSVSSTIATIIVCAMAAYTFVRREFPGKKLMLGIYSGMMFIHLGALTLKPAYELMVTLGLNKSVFGLIMMMTGAGGTSFFIMYAFMKSIPRDLDEAATLDGASFSYIFWRIMLPLSLPAIGVVGLFAFRGGWNSYILPLVFTMTQPKLQPITVGLVNLKYGVGGAVQSHYMLAGACISMIPILIIYLLANKSFMQMSAGSLKG
ncbi:carbohydrate ABC transporter permease [Paenibacillaceae bacterium]|nr:carbohydrate ABC transporter permease [Paenibacillaceae bacterium]